MNLSNLKMIVYDEADEIYLQEGNHISNKAYYKLFEEICINTQTLMFSATYPENVINNIKGFGLKYKGY